jgi:precorrin-2/cobalt-factor-2 C20-methyltransferase
MINDFSHALPGHLYLIGVGPGAPDLLTLRAVNILSSVDVIIAPRSSASSDSLALNVVRPHLNKQEGEQEVVEHIYPMERDNDQTARCWAQMAELAVERIARGQSVAHITIGDPLIYSTGAYLVAQIGDRIPAEKLHVISGISAMQAASARIGEPLITQNDRLLLLPADNLEGVEAAIDRCETLVIYKIGARIEPLIELLRRHNLVNKAHLVCYAEQAREQVFVDLEKAHGERLGYMSTMIVHIGHRSWE